MGLLGFLPDRRGVAAEVTTLAGHLELQSTRFPLHDFILLSRVVNPSEGLDKDR